MLLDRLLRQGAITEVIGSLSSGRTSLLTHCLRQATRRGGAVALIDADHVFDPVSAAAAGVDLRRLLWVRCEGRRQDALKAADLLARCPGFAVVALDVGDSPPRLSVAAAFRLRLAARRSGVALVVVGSRRIVGGAAALSVWTRRERLAWAGRGNTPCRLAGMCTGLQLVRKQGAPSSGVLERVWWTV